MKPRPILAALLVGLALAIPSRAAVSLTSAAAFNAATNDYTYTYSVSNTGPEDLVIVSIPVFSVNGSVFAPQGFSLNFDVAAKTVSLIEDGSIVTPEAFGPGLTVGPFRFNSPQGPAPTNFSAFDAAGTEFNGAIQAPIPEPRASLFVLLATAAVAARRRRF